MPRPRRLIMKYVVLETDAGKKLPFIFPDSLTHSIMSEYAARATSVCLGLGNSRRVTPISAGFTDISAASVHGYSESLKLKFKETDVARIIIGEAVTFIPDELVMKVFGEIMEGIRG